MNQHPALLFLAATLVACGTESSIATDLDTGVHGDADAADVGADTGDTDAPDGDRPDGDDTSDPVDASGDTGDAADDGAPPDSGDAAAGEDGADPDVTSDAAADAADAPDGEDDADAPETADGDDADVVEPPRCGAAICSPAEVCVAERCELVTGRCDGDGVCVGDARCCGAACDEPGLCIAWRDGQTNADCEARVEIGRFDASAQCEWVGPPDGDPFPTHRNVLGTPMVGNLPHPASYGAEIAFVSYNGADGGAESGIGSTPAYYGVIRVLDGDRCSQLESIHDPANPVLAASSLALGDLDGDGRAEIVAQRAVSGMVAFRWDELDARYVTFWVSTGSSISGTSRWDGPALHDLDDDGFPEVISSGEVFDGRTGARRNPGQSVGAAGILSVVADVDRDGQIELVVGSVYGWNRDLARWELEHTGAPAGRHYGVGDFGTDSPDGFDREARDGIAEVVMIGSNRAVVATLSGRIVLDRSVLVGGGPPTLADFDGDGRIEFASAGGSEYVVFDPDCAAAGDGCSSAGVRWTRPSQDLSSRTTGSSIFDFDDDGQAEAVYADECFTRIYDGSSGAVLYSSFRTSCTWFENPVIADTDGDGNTEIVVGSNGNCSVSCPAIDPIHPGLTCSFDEDCPTGSACAGGLCRCASDADCSSDSRCAATIDGSDALGQVCRAFHPPGVGLQGVRVLRDGLDRWASSRPVWNQHVYSSTNVGDDLGIPRTSLWVQAFDLLGQNSFRANEQGSIGASFVPDATVRAPSIRCDRTEEGDYVAATICNRGWRPIGGGMPVTFRRADDSVACTATTSGLVVPGSCLAVGCTAPDPVGSPVTVRINEDGDGRPSTVECIVANNVLVAETTGCPR